jgi:hypothetical protein
MTAKTSQQEKPLPSPRLEKSPQEEGLDLGDVDMSKEGRQGDAVVNKGASTTSVSSVLENEGFSRKNEF